MASGAIRTRVPVIARTLTELDGSLTATAAEEINVGKHRLKIVIRGDAESNVRLEEPRTAREEHKPTGNVASDNVGCIGWLTLIAAGLWLLNGC